MFTGTSIEILRIFFILIIKRFLSALALFFLFRIKLKPYRTMTSRKQNQENPYLDTPQSNIKTRTTKDLLDQNSEIEILARMDPQTDSKRIYHFNPPLTTPCNQCLSNYQSSFAKPVRKLQRNNRN